MSPVALSFYLITPTIAVYSHSTWYLIEMSLSAANYLYSFMTEFAADLKSAFVISASCTF